MNEVTQTQFPPFGRWDGSSPASIGRPTKVALAAVSGIFLVLFLAAAFIPMRGAVVGSGQLAVETHVKQIAHPTGGVIARILVRDGDNVRKDQLLMQLDTSVSGVRASLSSRTVDQLFAQQARLEAEREGRNEIIFPPELARRKDRAALDAMAAEHRLFALKAEERQGMRDQLNERIAQLNHQIRGLRSQIRTVREQQVLIGPEQAGVQSLYEKGLVTLNRRNQLERSAIEMNGAIASLEAQVAQAYGRITEIREQLLGLDQGARSDAGVELARTTTALNDETVQKASAASDFKRSLIRAPYDGVIDKLAFNTVGGVIPPGQTIMEIVPVGDRLIVEATIAPRDVDQINVGQDVRVRFTALSLTNTPELTGTLSFLSAERTTDREAGASFYRIRITIDPKNAARQNLKMVAGMPAEVFMSTESRSLLSYVLKPLRDQFARSLSD